MFGFSGQNILVTGGSSGIGMATVRMLLDAGAHVINLDYSEANNKVAQEVFAGRPFKVMQCNVADIDQVNYAVAEAIKESGQIHAMANIAGVGGVDAFDVTPVEQWHRIVDINLNGVYYCCHAIYPHMKANGYGRIVNVSSVAGKRGGGVLGTTAYAASKAGVLGLSKGIAREGGPYGITCNAVCPCLTKTAMVRDEQLSNPRIQNFIALNMPVGRWATPEEVGYGILFLLSKEASFITGEMLDVDGGTMMD